MAFLKDIARRPKIDGEFVDLPGRDQRRMFLRFAMARAQNALGDVLREAIGPDVARVLRNRLSILSGR